MALPMVSAPKPGVEVPMRTRPFLLMSKIFWLDDVATCRIFGPSLMVPLSTKFAVPVVVPTWRDPATVEVAEEEVAVKYWKVGPDVAVRVDAEVKAASIPVVPPVTPEPLPMHAPPLYVIHPAVRLMPSAAVVVAFSGRVNAPVVSLKNMRFVVDVAPLFKNGADVAT